MKRLLALLTVVSLMFVIGGLALADSPELAKSSTLETILKRGRIIVGLNAGYAPFEMLDKEGKMIGFDVEIAQLIADEMGVKLEIVNTDWDGIIPSLNTGKFDIIISGMTKTMKRALAVSFSDTYFITGQAIMVNNKHKGRVQSYKDLNSRNMVISVQLGTTGDIAATEKLPNAQIKRFQQQEDAALEVVLGRADAMVFDQPYLAIKAKQNPDKAYAVLEPFTYEHFGFAVRKGDPDFVRWLDLFIDQIKADGRYEGLFKKWFVDMPWLPRVDLQ